MENKKMFVVSNRKLPRVPRGNMILSFVESTFYLYGGEKSPGIGWYEHGKGFITFDTKEAWGYREFADDKALKAFKALFLRKNYSYAKEPVNFDKMSRLYAYQQAGVESIIRNKKILLADEQGLGKTVQIIEACNQLKPGRILIICPASLKLNWLAEFKFWSNIKAEVINGRKAIINPEAEAVILNYELCVVKDIYHQLLTQNFGFCAIDEAHYLKNPKASRTKNILGGGTEKRPIIGIIDNIPRVVPMTGTPLPNKTDETWPILSKLFLKRIPGPLRNWIDFTREFCGGYVNRDHGRAVWETRRCTKVPVFNQLLRQRIMIRRLKKDVLPQLPSKLYSMIDLTESKKVKKLLKDESEVKEDVLKELRKTGRLPPLEYMATLRRELAELKVPESVEFIKDLLENTNKVIVFAHHKTVISELEEALKEFNPVKIVGGTSLKKREEAKKLFQEDPETRLFLGNHVAAGVGLTLTAASNVVFVESSWVSGENEQAADRAHRIGQKYCVNVYFLVWNDSLDAYITRRSFEKSIIINKVLK